MEPSRFKAKDHAKAFNIKSRVATLDTAVISVKDARVNCGFFSCFVTWRRRWRVLRGHRHWRDRCDVHAGTLSSSLGAVCRLKTPRARVRSTPPTRSPLGFSCRVQSLLRMWWATTTSVWFLWTGPVVLLSVCCWNLSPSATGRSRRTVSVCGIARRSRRCSWSRTTPPGERILYLSTQMSL